MAKIVTVRLTIKVNVEDWEAEYGTDDNPQAIGDRLANDLREGAAPVVQVTATAR